MWRISAVISVIAFILAQCKSMLPRWLEWARQVSRSQDSHANYSTVAGYTAQHLSWFINSGSQLVYHFNSSTLHFLRLAYQMLFLSCVVCICLQYKWNANFKVDLSIYYGTWLPNHEGRLLTYQQPFSTVPPSGVWSEAYVYSDCLSWCHDTLVFLMWTL